MPSSAARRRSPRPSPRASWPSSPAPFPRLPPSAYPDPDHLTDRELDVLRLVVQGLRNKEIAAELGISENTAKFHLRNILDKLHAQNRAEVVARAMREGLVDDA